eukprot:3851120-Pleurochrysis_carterae.AAC.1
MLVSDKRAGLASKFGGRQPRSRAGETSKIQESAWDDYSRNRQEGNVPQGAGWVLPAVIHIGASAGMTQR